MLAKRAYTPAFFRVIHVVSLHVVRAPFLPAGSLLSATSSQKLGVSGHLSRRGLFAVSVLPLSWAFASDGHPDFSAAPNENKKDVFTVNNCSRAELRTRICCFIIIRSIAIAFFLSSLSRSKCFVAWEIDEMSTNSAREGAHKRCTAAWNIRQWTCEGNRKAKKTENKSLKFWIYKWMNAHATCLRIFRLCWTSSRARRICRAFSFANSTRRFALFSSVCIIAIVKIQSYLIWIFLQQFIYTFIRDDACHWPQAGGFCSATAEPRVWFERGRSEPETW